MRRTLAAALLCAALAAPATAAPRPAGQAATWLAGRVSAGGYVAGLDGRPDLANSVVVGIALAAAGTAPRTVDAIARYAAAHLDDYAVANGADRPGALGRLALLAAASGRDPNAFGGTAPRNRLVDRILATRQAVGVTPGLLADPVYNGLFSHALGLLGVAAARSLTDEQQAARDAAADFLATQQCAGGGWQNTARLAVAGLPLTACETGQNGPDSNTSSVAVQALAAVKREPGRDPLAWFAAAQNAAGGWGYSPGGATDADSTALAIQALLARGVSPSGGRFARGGVTPYAALLALRTPECAFSYQRVPARPNLYATAEAVPAVAGTAFPVKPPRTTVARVPCTR